LIDEIIAAAPRRIIINPGAENAALAARAKKAGIEVIHDCTLVMLRAGEF
jgi:predicted CoA-binding protein